IVHSRLIKFKTDASTPPLNLIPVPDAAASWEQPDDLTVLLKIRPEAKWHNIAPMNGQPLNASQVVWSFQRQLDLKATAGDLPAMDGMTAVDPQTLRLHTKAPNADFLIQLAAAHNKILPREAIEARGGTYDAAPFIGTGAWLLDEYKENTTARMKRNPDYYGR